MEQIKAGLRVLSVEERADVQEYLDILSVVTRPGYQREIDEAMQAMDAGDKVSLREFIRANGSPEAIKLLHG